jgi:hypothetical protein
VECDGGQKAGEGNRERVGVRVISMAWAKGGVKEAQG